MIAPIRPTDPETAAARRRLRQAHQVVVSTLLDPQRGRKAETPPVPGWQAWLFAGWTAAVVLVYFASMLGWW